MLPANNSCFFVLSCGGHMWWPLDELVKNKGEHHDIEELVDVIENGIKAYSEIITKYENNSQSS